MVFAAFGLLIGPAVFGLARLDFDHKFVHGIAEVTLILVLFSDAVRIDLRLLRRDHNLPVRMLLIGMPLTIVLGTLVGLALPLGLSLWEAALLAAILAPTDAALGLLVVSSPLVPTRIRQALNVESGLNDGIALPVVLIFASLASVGGVAADQNWITFAAMQVTLGPITGVVVGGLGAWLLDRAAAKGLDGGELSRVGYIRRCIYRFCRGRKLSAATGLSRLSLPAWSSATAYGAAVASCSSLRRHKANS